MNPIEPMNFLSSPPPSVRGTTRARPVSRTVSPLHHYFGLGLFLAGFLVSGFTATPAQTRLSILTWENSKETPVPCRIHLRNEAGQPIKPASFPSWNDHFVFPGKATLELPAGRYSYELERGPEYRRLVGDIALVSENTTDLVLHMERITDLKSEGWWSGDLHIHRPPEDIPLLAKAEDLQVAPVITWWNQNNRWKNHPLPEPTIIAFGQNRSSDLMAGEDEREGGALLFFHLPKPLPIQNAGREYPSPTEFLKEAHRAHPDMHVDIEKPFWWDVPVWLATGLPDTIGLANNHMYRRQMLENEAWGKPRDTTRFPAPRGNGFWTQEIYYHILNSGLRIPPSAGSASGVLPNPVGYNRVYVHIDGDFTEARWWQALRTGRSFVSNGPLLRARANGAFPGEQFHLTRGETLDLELTARFDTQDETSAFEIIQNGRVVRTVPMTEWRRTGTLGSVSFQTSGWFLVRAIGDRTDTFRFASTAPWYVRAEDTPERISRASVRFFLDWVQERMDRIRLDNPEQQRSVMSHQLRAKAFWEDRLSRANAP